MSNVLENPIVRWRKTKNLTRRDLAKAISMPESTLEKLEIRTEGFSNCNIGSIAKIASFFNLKIENVIQALEQYEKEMKEKTFITCSTCEHCHISKSDNKEKYEARCSKKGKRGPKLITWTSAAFLKPVAEGSVTYKKVSGRSILLKILKAKKTPPNWCPLKDKMEQVE